MSNRPEITMMLSISTEMYINPHGDPRIYWAKEVTFDYATKQCGSRDYMKFKPVIIQFPELKKEIFTAMR